MALIRQHSRKSPDGHIIESTKVIWPISIHSAYALTRLCISLSRQGKQRIKRQSSCGNVISGSYFPSSRVFKWKLFNIVCLSYPPPRIVNFGVGQMSNSSQCVPPSLLLMSAQQLSLDWALNIRRGAFQTPLFHAALQLYSMAWLLWQSNWTRKQRQLRINRSSR